MSDKEAVAYMNADVIVVASRRFVPRGISGPDAGASRRATQAGQLKR